MNNNFLVFSHEQDVDGLFSAAILRMTYPHSQIILTNYGFENMVKVRKEFFPLQNQPLLEEYNR